MEANKQILISASVYAILFIVAWLTYSNMRFTGSDAAGNGLESGLTFLLGLGILFLIAIALTIYNAFSFGAISHTWIKFIFFVPIILPSLVFAHEVLEIGKPKPPPPEDPLWLTFEIRISEKKENLSFRYRGFNRGFGSRMNYIREENNLHYYQLRTGIHSDTDRTFSFSGIAFNSPKYNLDVPEKPIPIEFTDWIELPPITNDSTTTRIAYRFKVEE